MNIKPFGAEQLYDCITVVARHPSPSAAATGRQAELQRLGNMERDRFIELFRAPGGHPVDYQAGIPQALTLMHGGVIHSATQLQSSGALQSLQAPFFSDQQRVETLFLATLSRFPTESERQQALAQIDRNAGAAERSEWLSDILWALFNSAEFTMNH
jgi:hypothetical protein